MKTNDQSRLMQALALIEEQFQEALGRRHGIQKTAETMHDDWQQKISQKGHDPAREERLELRLASLLAAQQTGPQD